MFRRILVVPDTHFPAHRATFFQDLRKIIKNKEPDAVVLIGDLVDSHAISHHTPHPDAQSAQDEFGAAVQCVKQLVSAISTRPTYMCLGNHDVRYMKLAADVRIPGVYLKSFKELFNLPDTWQVANDHIVDNILFTHGKSSTYGKTAHAYGMPSVEGHWHSKLGIVYFNSPNRELWSAYAGSALDDSSLAATYAANNLNKSIYGYLLITDGHPEVIKP